MKYIQVYRLEVGDQVQQLCTYKDDMVLWSKPGGLWAVPGSLLLCLATTHLEDRALCGRFSLGPASL